MGQSHRAPGISVVVPNARGFPCGLVRDLAAQLQEGDEIIVVRNEPTGGRRHWIVSRPSASLTTALGPSLEPALLVLKSSPGAAAARNTGWQAAQHPLVLFLDDDVAIPATFLEVARSGTENEHLHGVTTFRVRSKEGPWLPLITTTISLDRGAVDRRSAGVPLALSDAWRYGVSAAMLVRRDVLEGTGGFKEKLGAGRKHGGGEDLEFLWHASRHTAIRYVGDLAVEHHDVDELADVGRKFRHYGRAIARLSGTSKERAGLDAVVGYCIHLASAVAGRGRLTEHRPHERCMIRMQAFVALVETGRVYVGSLLVHRRADLLCNDCLAW